MFVLVCPRKYNTNMMLQGNVVICKNAFFTNHSRYLKAERSIISNNCISYEKQTHVNSNISSCLMQITRPYILQYFLAILHPVCT